MTARTVRVVAEGDARELPGGMLRVLVHGGGTILVDPTLDSVTVEDVVPPRVWTDGDVVQSIDTAGRATWTLTRAGGEWVSSHPNVPRGHWTDEVVTAHLEASAGWGQLVVLRYQAGEGR